MDPAEIDPAYRIQNVAGQWEQETKSRTWNVLEPVIAMALIQVVMWGLWFPLELAGNDTGETIAYAALGGLGVYFLLVSPFLHKDTLKGWGLGDPRHVIERLRHGDAKSKAFFIGILSALVVVAIVAFFLLWPDIADALGLMDETEAVTFQQTPTGPVVIALLAIVVALFLGLVVIRYDNFLNSLKMAFIIIGLLGVPLFLLALAIGDLSGVTAEEFAIGVLGYIFWGALQQFLFASYFGTRFRKAFSPAQALEDPETATPSEEAPLRKKRIVVALCSGSFFGLIHLPSWTLTAFTMVLGVFLSWLFMKDGNRNLIALGFIHGFLGSMAGQFFSDDVVEMSVGPSAVPDPVVPWMGLVVACVGVLLGVILAIWFWYERRKQ